MLLMKQNFTRYIIVETVSFFNCFSHLIENYVVEIKEIKDKRFPVLTLIENNL